MVATRKPSIQPPTTTSRTPSSTFLPDGRPVPTLPTTPPPPRDKGKAKAKSPLGNSLIVEPPSKSRPENGHSLVASQSTTSTPKKSSKSKSKSKSKKVAPAKPARPKPKNSAFSFANIFTVITLSFLSIYAASVCTTDYTLTSPVCYSLYQVRSTVVPPITYVLDHPVIKPYTQKLTPLTNIAVQEWNARVVPLWREHVVPRLAVIEARTRPIRQSTEARVWLVWDKTTPYLEKAAVSAEPALLILQREATQLHPYWVNAKLNARHAFIHLQYRVYKPAINYLAPHIARAVIWRKNYVDVHILRMYERLQELATANRESETISQPPVQAHITALTSEKDSATEASADEPTISGGSQLVVVKAVTSTASATSAPAPTPEQEIPEPSTDDADHVSRSSAIFVSAETVEPASPEPPSEAVVNEHLTEKDPSPADPEPGAPPVVDELDDFLKEIDFDGSRAAEQEEGEEQEGGAATSTSGQPNIPKHTPLTAEQIAEKREGLEKKQAKWEEKARVYGAQTEADFKNQLEELRAQATAELEKKWTEEINELEGAGTRSLKNVDLFLARLRSMAKDKESTPEKRTEAWESILTKVDDRFMKVVHDLEAKINTWWTNEVEMKEVELLRNMATKVESYIGNAQASLGMEWSWLEDVSYLDWQRYHKLGASITSTKEALAKSLEDKKNKNQVQNALKQVETKFEETVEGWSNRIRALERRGFQEMEEDLELPQGDDITKTSTTTSENTSSAVEGTVSIPPIPSMPSGEVLEEANAEIGIIGRDPTEVKEALERAQGEIPITESPASERSDADPAESKAHIHGEL